MHLITHTWDWNTSEARDFKRSACRIRHDARDALSSVDNQRHICVDIQVRVSAILHTLRRSVPPINIVRFAQLLRVRR